ncbi:hypothetical protein [Campylobacter mucosalis]|uniref:Putative membrane protein n=1 Tax=Campylobacter mucosalis CCUG 21559 TaxID=1032067 RepID=A0A6G5QER7_9BACT|nr:hypothetical protein [Campylobacter mucosalis]QCD44203.1 putative membrane protein [Campylobacter mucosalis CCUG 21559]
MPLPLIPVVLGAGAIGTALFGAKKGYDAYTDNEEASRYNNEAQEIYENSQDELDTSRRRTNDSINNLGNLKLKVYAEVFEPFIDTFVRIKNYESDGEINLEVGNFRIDSKEFEALKSELLDIKTAIGAAAALGSGAAAGFGAFGLTGVLATASTGTAISTLSGVAATNATLAWLGGGSLAAGGFGMAGGVAVLGGLVAGPALAVAGWVLSSKAETAKNEAYSNLEKARAIKETNDTAILELNHITEISDKVKSSLSKIAFDYFEPILDDFMALVNKNNDFATYSQSQKEIVHKNVILAQSVKNLISVALLDENGKLTAQIRRAKRKGEKFLQKLTEVENKYR